MELLTFEQFNQAFMEYSEPARYYLWHVYKQASKYEDFTDLTDINLLKYSYNEYDSVKSLMDDLIFSQYSDSMSDYEINECLMKSCYDFAYLENGHIIAFVDKIQLRSFWDGIAYDEDHE